ncbi:MAG TPA: hypothetical protein VGH28_02515 [Polyangiaceae bacterium]
MPEVFALPPAMRVDGLVAVKRPVILHAFTREILMRGFPTPQATPAEIARPADACLGALVRALGAAPPDDRQKLDLASDYAQQRIRLGYDLRALLTEFGVLRAIVLDALAGPASSTDVTQRVADFLHDVMVEAAIQLTHRASGRMPITSALTPGLASVRATR